MTTLLHGRSQTRRAARAVGRLVVALLLAIAVLPATSRAENSERVALVIGNGSYQHVPRLANPGNDARLIAATLASLGFRLVGGGAQTDLDKAGFDRAVREFGREATGAKIALFYYSGHGLQIDGSNYLVPVDADPTSPKDLPFMVVNAQVVLDEVNDPVNRLNIIILDACRNNPFSGRGLRAAGGGLAAMRAPSGTMISYATQPDSVARDGDGADSPYTAALAQALHTPNVDVLHMFNTVGLDVMRATGNNQQPWVASSPLDGDFVLAHGSSPTTASPSAAAPSTASSDTPAPSQQASASRSTGMPQLTVPDAQTSPSTGSAPQQFAWASPPMTSSPQGQGDAQRDMQIAARRFVGDVLASWSHSDPEPLTALARLYAMRVDYYGKATNAANVLRLKVGFAERWPVRSYRPQPDTMAVSCDPVTHRCVVTGVMDWDISAPDRHSSSTGTSRLTMTLDMSGAAPLIVAESTETLTRQVSTQ
jgi:uncharacterized caspase-like protein